MTTLFIFRRDYRIIDNKGLDFAMSNFKNIIPIFIFTPEQAIKSKNEFFSDNSFQFLCESLKELDADLKKNGSKLHIFHGKNVKVLESINKKEPIKNIVFNKDYTPYALKRDKKILGFCKKNNINCHAIEDYLLQPIGTFNKEKDKPYVVFTPFKNNVLKQKIDKPSKDSIKNIVSRNIGDKLPEYKINENILVNGGRKNGLNKLEEVSRFKDYSDSRNVLSLSTTHLSAYIKYGCLSIREVYKEIVDNFSKEHTLLSQLIWREFYFYISYYFPKVLNGENYLKKYDGIEWNKSDEYFKKWTEGLTGYPIVDAGMRELNKTGYMHNRARLITSNFLNRLLGYHWTKGEKYFAQKLTDYDPSVNNGNWQWIASTGTDPKPYFQRLFNPILQSKKFDKKAEYIKKWLPELKDVKSEHLHEWEKYNNKYNVDYPEPIIDYKKARQRSVEMYKKVLT